MSVLPQTENHVSPESATVASRRQTVSIWNRLAGYVQNWGAAIVIALFGLVVWELSVRLFDVQEWLLPPVSKILSELIADPPLFISNGWVTLREILVGFMVSTTFGFVMATGMFWSRLLEAISLSVHDRVSDRARIHVSPVARDLDGHRYDAESGDRGAIHLFPDNDWIDDWIAFGSMPT